MSTSCSAFFSAFTGRTHSKAPGSAWRRYNASFIVTAAASGPKGRWTAAPRSSSPFLVHESANRAGQWRTTMTVGLGRILMVEDDPKDVELSLTALEEYNLANEVVVVGDGEEALDYL